MPEKMKKQTAVNEYKRRWKNTSTHVSSELVKDITREYSRELLAAGYSTAWIRDALESALKGYEKVIELVMSGKCQRNRPGYCTIKSRRTKRLAGNTTWYNKVKDTQTVNQNSVRKSKTRVGKHRTKLTEAIMMVLYTPESKLKQLLTTVERALKNNSQLK